MTGYRLLPHLAGRWFMPVAFFARLPFSMTIMGVLLLVSATTGSVAEAGLASAAYSLGTAAFGPVQGRLADRLGQRAVLLVAAPLNAAALVAVTLAALGGAHRVLLLAACAVAGASAPQIAALMRVRWMALTGARPDALRTALAYESTADEVTFVLGPALVGVIAATGHPAVALVLAAGLVAVLGVAIALHPTVHAVPVHRRGAVGVPGRTPMGGVLRAAAAPVLGMLAVGTFFGSTQASVTAVATAAGQAGAAGLLYALMGVGSAVTALAVVALPERVSLRARWVVGAAGMAAGSAAGLVVGSLGQLAVVLALVGLFVGPTLVTLFSLGSAAVAARDGGTAMTMVVSGNVVGVALGAWLGGAIADVTPSTGFAVPTAACLVLVLVGLVGGGRRGAAPGRT